MNRPNISIDEYYVDSSGGKHYRSHPDISTFAHIGVDVSKHNGHLDFNEIKRAGVEFVIIRAGYRRSISQKDPLFEEHYSKAKEAGLDVGAYWYSYAESILDAEKEANVCLQAIHDKKFEYPIYFDVEENRQFKIGKIFCTNIVHAFCDVIERNGYFAGLYMSRYPLTDYIDEETQKKYALWVAQYNKKCSYPGLYGMWQFSDLGRIKGVNDSGTHNTIDMNASFVDYPSIMKDRGLNGYSINKPVNNNQEEKTDSKYNYNIVVGTFDDKLVAQNELAKIKNSYPNARILATYKK